jgi:hypothetical protein
MNNNSIAKVKMKIYTMTKEVLGCGECPVSKLRLLTNVASCGHPDASGRGVEAGKIPDWCPLPDAKEGTK